MKKTTRTLIAIFSVIICALIIWGIYFTSMIVKQSGGGLLNQTDTIATLTIEKQRPFETKWSLEYFSSMTPEQNPIAKRINLSIAKTADGGNIDSLKNSFEDIVEDVFFANYAKNLEIYKGEQESLQLYGYQTPGNMGSSCQSNTFLTGTKVRLSITKFYLKILVGQL